METSFWYLAEGISLLSDGVLSMAAREEKFSNGPGNCERGL